MIDLIAVESSNVMAIGYADGVLAVKFRGGTLYEYRGVPPEVHAALMAAASKGSFLARHVVRNSAYQVMKIAPTRA